MPSFSELDLAVLGLAYEQYPRGVRMGEVLAHPVVKNATNKDREMCIIDLHGDGLLRHDMIDTSTLSGGKSIAIRDQYHIWLTDKGVEMVEDLMPEPEPPPVEGFRAES